MHLCDFLHIHTEAVCFKAEVILQTSRILPMEDPKKFTVLSCQNLPPGRGAWFVAVALFSFLGQ